MDRLTNTMVLGQPGGFQANEPNFRGIDQPGSEAETVLPLLNGRPLRDAYTSARSMSIYRSFPLYAIERLEIIRGPGSVLYGSNAFAGVINIITKDPEEDFNNAVAVGYGNLDTSNTDLVVNYKKGEFSAMAAGNVFNTEGWQFSQVDGNKVSDSFNMEQFRYGVTGQAKYKDLTANIYLAHRDDTTTSTPTGKNFPDKEDSLDSRHFADLQYKSDWGDGWTGQLNFTYNALYYNTFGIQIQFDSWDYLFEGTIYKKFSDNLNFFVGGTYERQEASLNNNTVSFDNDRFLTYAQLDYKLWDNLKLIAGVQVNKNEGLDYNTSLRAGGIMHFTEHFGMKLLYGEAYRSPNAIELGTDTAGFKPNPELNPQTIRSTDAQFFYYKDQLNLALTFYYAEIIDNIFQEQPAGATRPSPFNGLGAVYQGVEFEGKYLWSPNLETSLSLSYQTNESAIGEPDVGAISNFMAKGGVFYQAPKGVSLGLYGSYFGQPGANEASPANSVNPDPSSFLWLSFNARTELRSLLKKPHMPDIHLQLFVDNLMNEDVFIEDRTSNATNTNQQRGDTKIMGNIIYNF